MIAILITAGLCAVGLELMPRTWRIRLFWVMAYCLFAVALLLLNYR